MRRGLSITTVFAALLFITSAHAQAPTPTPPPATAPNVDGSWLGNLEVGPNQTARVDIEFGHRADGMFGGDMFIPDQSRNGIGLDTAAFDGSKIHAGVTKFGMTIDGTLSGDGNVITTEWKQGGKVTPLILHRSTIWSGPVTIPEVDLAVAFKLKETKPGQWDGTVNYPEQKNAESVVSGASLSDGSVFIVNQAGNATFDGKMTKDSKEMAGFWRQDGKTYAITLKKNAAGDYAGPIRILPHQALMVFKFAASDTGGQLVAVFRSIEGGVTEVPVDTVSIVKQTVSLMLPSIGATFVGEQSKDATAIAGEWKQSGRTLPLTLTKYNSQAAEAKKDDAAPVKAVSKTKK